MAYSAMNLVGKRHLIGIKSAVYCHNFDVFWIRSMTLLTVYEKKALANIQQNDVWFSVSQLGSCRLSTLNKLVDKGYLERIRRPGPYVPNESILFRKPEEFKTAVSG